MSAPSTPVVRSRGLTFDQRMDIVGAVVFFLGVLLLFALFSSSNSMFTGSLISGLSQIFGIGRFVVPVVLMIVGVWIFVRNFGTSLPRIEAVRVTGLLILAIVILTSLHMALQPISSEASYTFAEEGRGGGFVGAVVLEAFIGWFGWIGTLITLLGITIIGLILLLGLSTRDLYLIAQTIILQLRGQKSAELPTTPLATSRYPDQARPDYGDLDPPLREDLTPDNRPAPMHPPRMPSNAPSNAAASPYNPSTLGSAAPVARKPPRPTTPSRATPGTGGEPVVASNATPASPYKQPIVIGGEQPWVLPKVEDVLDKDDDSDNTADNESFRHATNIIEETLSAFGAPGRVVEVNRGPTITQFGVEPEYITQRNGKKVKVKVSKIASLSDDLALALSAPSIRIEAPVPGKGYVGIEVPNAESTVVSLRDVMESPTFARVQAKSSLGLALGQDVGGQAVVADLTAMPHMLIAGTTGSGKSVCVNAIIAALILTNTPDDLKFLMVDPKRVELTTYKGLPHLLVDVVVDLERVVGSLQWVAREMNNRYSRFSEMGVRNISEFNKRALTQKEKKMPYLVVVIDELADLMMLAPEETEKTITRLAQMARATGIHLILATQRPSVDVVTGLIKANFPARISFAVASSVDSRVILDQPGAEKLLGRGDMLFQSPDSPAPLRLQGVFVSDKELTRLVRYWKGAFIDQTAPTVELPNLPPTEPLPRPGGPQRPKPTEQIPLWNDPTAGTAASGAAGSSIPVMSSMLGKPKDDEDDLYHEAVDAVRDMRKASISLLQRRLRIGYTRAARLIDIMEERGIVGPAKAGAQQREVLDYGDGAPAPGTPTNIQAGRPIQTTRYGEDDEPSLVTTDDNFDYNQAPEDDYEQLDADEDDEVEEDDDEDDGNYFDI